MIRIIFKILLGLLALNTISYWLFSESSSQLIVDQKYLEFNQRRLANEWNNDTSNQVLVASCGDEFFRNIKRFETIVHESNPRDLKGDEEFYQVVWRVDDDIDILGTFLTHTDTLKSKSCIIYKVCSQRTIPALLKRIEYQYFFSDSPTDFHIMYYNEQMEMCNPIYLWLFGFWIEFNGQITLMN